MPSREGGSDPLQWRVPADVARAVCARWPNRGPSWCGATAGELAMMCARFGVLPVVVFPARYGFVVGAETAGGASLVLKSTVDPFGSLQAQAAQLLGDLGVGPRVHEVVETYAGTWTVMDRVVPGTPGGSARGGELADALAPLAAANLRPHLPLISEWLRGRLRDGGTDDRDPYGELTTLEERAEALARLNDLVVDEPRSLCHGDLSPGNVLCGNEKLMLVDPRGMCGDIAYDVAVVSRKIGIDVAVLTTPLGLDADRARTWARVAAAAQV